MRLLLDTHVLLWWLTSERMSARAKAAIASADSTVWVSTATVWELSIKSALGKLTFPDDLGDQLAHHQFDVLPVALDHALAVRSLPALHANPFDRMLVAQARCDELTLVTPTRTSSATRWPYCRPERVDLVAGAATTHKPYAAFAQTRALCEPRRRLHAVSTRGMPAVHSWLNLS